MNNAKPVFKFILIILLALVLIIAILQNTAAAPIRFLMLNLAVPVIAVILITFFIGFLAGLLTFPILFRKNSEKKAPDEQKEKKQKKDGQNNPSKEKEK